MDMRGMFKLIKMMISSILIVILMVAALGIYITFIERKLLVVKEHEVILKDNGENQLKIVQFTDTQLGEYYSLKDLERAVKKINGENADIVVFTGDLIDHASKYEDLYEVAPVLSKIEAKFGKYAVYGNHDIGGGAERYYEDIMNEAGFEVLENSSTTLQVNDETIKIMGGDEAMIGWHDAQITTEGIQEDDINLLLLHEPDLIDYYMDYPIDLALSGHSHGGQVALPVFGPIIKNHLAEKYNKGLYSIDNERKTKIYVSSGLGNTKLPFRFGNIPVIESFNIVF